MRSKNRKLKTFLGWLKRNPDSQKRVDSYYKKATPKEKGISFIDDDFDI